MTSLMYTTIRCCKPQRPCFLFLFPELDEKDLTMYRELAISLGIGAPEDFKNSTNSGNFFLSSFMKTIDVYPPPPSVTPFQSGEYTP